MIYLKLLASSTFAIKNSLLNLYKRLVLTAVSMNDRNLYDGLLSLIREKLRAVDGRRVDELEKFENENNNKGLGKIRQLVDEYHTDPARAVMFLDRISEINPELGKIIKDMTYTSDTGNISHMQDILHLMSFRKNENN